MIALDSRLPPVRNSMRYPGALATTAIVVFSLGQVSRALADPPTLAGTVAPFRTIKAADWMALEKDAAVVKLGPTDVPWKTAASVDINVSVPAVPEANVPAFSQAERASRRGNAAAAKVYRGIRSQPLKAGELTPPGQVVPPAPNLLERYNFSCTGDEGQAWATMSELGHPFLFARVSGHALATASSSVNATVALTGSGHREIYLEFSLPPVKVTGRQGADMKGQKVSLWQSRAGGDLFVNGHPVWSFASTRFTELNESHKDANGVNHPGSENNEARHLVTFGAGPALTAGDSLDATQAPSPVQVVQLLLGRFAAPQAIEVALTLRVDASVDDPCIKEALPRGGPTACPNAVVDSTCAESSASVDWRDDLPQPLFMIKTVM